jgi:hypothetical protein
MGTSCWLAALIQVFVRGLNCKFAAIGHGVASIDNVSPSADLRAGNLLEPNCEDNVFRAPDIIFQAFIAQLDFLRQGLPPLSRSSRLANKALPYPSARHFSPIRELQSSR